MSQIVPIAVGDLIPDAYEAYAENFDLSLLPSDSIDLPMSPQSDISSQSPQVSLDYIPTTIYHDQLPIIKTEKVWNDETISILSEQHQQQNDTNMLIQQQYHHHHHHHHHHHQNKQYQLYSTTATTQLPNHDGINKNLCQTVFPPSPCPSIEYNFANTPIKQEYHILPPSPPESSCGASSPHSFNDIKNEPDNDCEPLIDINSLLDNSSSTTQTAQTAQTTPTTQTSSTINSDRKSSSSSSSSSSTLSSDHQLLREYLEDTTFQRKHNLKPLALESLIGGLGGHSDIEPVISLALEHAKRDAQDICSKLQISADPQQWSPVQVHAWLRTTIEQFQLPQIDDLESKFPDDGTTFSLLSEEDFIQRAPEFGSTLHAQLEVWKVACCAGFSTELNSISANSQNWSSECSSLNNMDFTDDEDDEMLPVANPPTVGVGVGVGVGAGVAVSPIPVNAIKSSTTTTTTRSGGSHIHLWQFLKELLSTPQVNGTAIRWLDRSKGVFKIEDSVRVAKLWGRRKNRPAMNYDKLSRSIRQYYKKGIMKKTERSQRLVYQFCHPYCL